MQNTIWEENDIHRKRETIILVFFSSYYSIVAIKTKIYSNILILKITMDDFISNATYIASKTV